MKVKCKYTEYIAPLIGKINNAIWLKTLSESLVNL